MKALTKFEQRDKQIKKLYSKRPVLRGGIYCSPWCGHNCTKATYDECVKESTALARRMGKGWKPYVWENLGWHYRVFKGGSIAHHTGILEITVRAGCDYTAWIQTTPQFIVSSNDPKVALRKAVKLFDAHIANLLRLRALVDPLL